MSEEKFQLKIIHDKFSEALDGEDDVKIAQYLDTFNELDKFFVLLGSVFGFVSTDLNEKVGILRKLLENSDQYTTIRTMVEHESSNNLLTKKGFVSGSRTLLRLHRGLDFFRVFLRKISELQDLDNTGPCCQEAYDNTLAVHHSWLIKTAARLGMLLLPKKLNLLQTVCSGDEAVAETVEHLPKTLELIDQVFDRTDKLYTEKELHSLP